MDRKGIIRHIGIRTPSAITATAARIRELLTVRPPAINLPIKALDFGEDVPAGESRTLTLVVQNTGGEDLDISNIQSDLEGVSVNTTELVVTAGDSAKVEITFNPSETGPFSGTLTILSNDPENGSITVSFSGNVIAAKPPAISVRNTSLDFGEDVQAQVSHTLTLVVQNTGENDLSITDIQSDREGVTFSSTELTVAAGDSARVEISFTPAEAGPFSGTLTILSNDPENGSITVSFSGTAIAVDFDARADFDGDGEIGFTDFIAFARAFNTENATFDLNGNGVVDFPDFVEFAKNFGKSLT